MRQVEWAVRLQALQETCAKCQATILAIDIRTALKCHNSLNFDSREMIFFFQNLHLRKIYQMRPSWFLYRFVSSQMNKTFAFLQYCMCGWANLSQLMKNVALAHCAKYTVRSSVSVYILYRIHCIRLFTVSYILYRLYTVRSSVSSSRVSPHQFGSQSN